MRKRLLEDLLINKLNGYYLILLGYDHYYASKLVFMFTQMIIAVLVFTRMIPPRHHS